MDATQVRRAFLDALAVGESGGDYTILYGGGHFSGFAKFPQWAGKQGPAGPSHAAGRYQFEPATWYEQQEKLGLLDFSPASQDAAAWDLACSVYLRRVGRSLPADLAADHLELVATALRKTWTSLSAATFPARYRAALAAIPAPAAAPLAAPPPSRLRRWWRAALRWFA